MSGGHYDYLSLQLGHLADDIADDANKEQDEAVRNAMDYCAAQLRAMGALARAIEWYMSGDYGPEQVLAEFKKATE